MPPHHTNSLAGIALSDYGDTGVAITYNGDIYGWVQRAVSIIPRIPYG